VDRQWLAAEVVGDGRSDALEDLVNIFPENEKATKGRNRRREPVGRGWSSSTSYVSIVVLPPHQNGRRAYKGRRGDKPSVCKGLQTVTPSAGRWLHSSLPTQG
jgi:hypothetical protein